MRALKGKPGRLLSLLSLTPLAACGGGGAVSEPDPVPSGTGSTPDPDYSEGPTGTFTGRDSAGLTLSQGSASTNLTVISKGGNDTITTGSGNDTIRGAAGDDTIVSGGGSDLIRGGLGADNISAGTGNDVIVVVGSTTAGQYDSSDITNPLGSGLDLSSVLSLADLNDQPTSEGAAGEIIDGGAGSDTLVIYGTVDLTGLTIQNVTTLVVHSVVTLSPEQLTQFTTVDGDGQSVINIVDDPDDDTIYNIDLSALDLSGIASISTSGDVQITLSSLDDLDGIGSITGDGNLQVTIVDGGSGTVTADQVSAMISGTASIEAETPAVSIDDITANEAVGTATFSVTLSAASGQSVTVGYNAPDGTSGILTFAPGETSKSFSTAWADDGLDEANEAQTATLSSPTNAAIADGSGSLTIIDDDASPVLTSTATVSIEENTTSVLTVTATDADGDILSYAISGVDAWRFDLDAVSGLVAFKVAPDFENPGDAYGDNVYDLIVNASDGFNSTSQNVTITVTNGNDSPAGSVTISGTAVRDQTLTATNTLSDPDGMGPVSYQWQRDGVDIAGATTGTYLLTLADTGTAITVIANYTDSRGTAESVGSAAVNPVLASILELDALDGSNGFVLNGIDAGDVSGRSVSNAGDVNGDGYDDLIIGAPFADPNGNSYAGESYVVYGGIGIDGEDGVIDLSALDGTTGFAVIGINASDYSGRSVSNAGDVNGDGYDDLIIGAADADPEGKSGAGESYLIYGGVNVDGGDGVLDLSTLDGVSGFVLNGIDTGDVSGLSVSNAGDVNGDGYDDLIIGAPFADPGPSDNFTGESYIVYGGIGIDGGDGTLGLSTLDGSTGFVLKGIDEWDRSGWSVSGAGDVNGDGYDDVIIGAYEADPNGITGAGESYLVYGGVNVDGGDGVLDLSSLDGTFGFVLNGISADDNSGWSFSNAGDVNGDGYDDLIIGAYRADPNGIVSAGESYLVYGGISIDGGDGILDLSSLDGTSGFVLNGIDASDDSGYAVSDAGDLNGDGYDDIIVAAPFSNLFGAAVGESYVVYGGTSIDGGDGVFELSELDGYNGFVINGIDPYDASGWSVSGAGDLNGDGYDDLIIGAPDADLVAGSSLGSEGNRRGESYVIYGSATSTDIHMGSTGSDTLTGGASDERFIGREGDDTITSGPGDDVLVFDGDFGNDTVTDYVQGADLFDFSDSEIIDDISDLTISIVGGDTVLDDGLGNTITLTGFTGTLTNGDFDFA